MKPLITHHCIRSFHGHSGCRIFLHKELSTGNFFVRKVSGNAAYNRRLKKQFIKQKKFQQSHLKVPAILSYGEMDGLFYFDMEFIPGVNMARYIKDTSEHELDKLLAILFSTLDDAPRTYQPDSHRIFMRKIVALEKQLPTEDSEISAGLSKLKMHDFSSIPLSPCCGDLTLENMIVHTNGELYMVDLMDSFFNSWMMDFSKLLMDLMFGWSYRDENEKSIPWMKLTLVRNRIVQFILSLEHGDTELQHIYHLVLLHLLRIYPYAKDDKIKCFLRNSIKETIKMIS